MRKGVLFGFVRRGQMRNKQIGPQLQGRAPACPAPEAILRRKPSRAMPGIALERDGNAFTA